MQEAEERDITAKMDKGEGDIMNKWMPFLENVHAHVAKRGTRLTATESAPAQLPKVSGERNGQIQVDDLAKIVTQMRQAVAVGSRVQALAAPRTQPLFGRSASRGGEGTPTTAAFTLSSTKGGLQQQEEGCVHASPSDANMLECSYSERFLFGTLVLRVSPRGTAKHR